jgi:hypothetical protein
MNNNNSICVKTSIVYKQFDLFDFASFNNFTNKVKFVILSIINLISFLMNFISVLVFLKILKDKRRTNERESSSLMYKYLLFKSICDTISSLIKILIIFFKSNIDRSTLIGSIWTLFFDFYFTQSFYLASGFFEIAATFNCAISIENKLKWLQTKLSFYITTIGLFAFCFVYQSFYFVFKHIEKSESFNNKTSYYINDNYKYYSILENFELSTLIIRDLVCLVLLVIINTFILFKMVQIRKRRSHLQSNSQSANRISSRQAEYRKIKMIVSLFIVYTLGHLPFILFQLGVFTYNMKLDNYGRFYTEIILTISLSASFFIYTFFDKKFNRVLLNIFKH